MDPFGQPLKEDSNNSPDKFNPEVNCNSSSLLVKESNYPFCLISWNIISDHSDILQTQHAAVCFW